MTRQDDGDGVVVIGLAYRPYRFRIAYPLRFLSITDSCAVWDSGQCQPTTLLEVGAMKKMNGNVELLPSAFEIFTELKTNPDGTTLCRWRRGTAVRKDCRMCTI